MQVIPIYMHQLATGPLAQLSSPDGKLSVVGHILRQRGIHPRAMWWCNYPHEMPMSYWPKLRKIGVVGYDHQSVWTKPAWMRLSEYEHDLGENMVYPVQVEHQAKRVWNCAFDLGYDVLFCKEVLP